MSWEGGNAHSVLFTCICATPLPLPLNNAQRTMALFSLKPLTLPLAFYYSQPQASMRSMLDSLASGMAARESLESRLSTQEDAHADTSTHGASLVDAIASLETQTTFEFASVADAQGALRQEITHVSNGLGDTIEDLSKVWDSHESLAGTVRNHGVSLAEMAADKADRTFVSVSTLGWTPSRVLAMFSSPVASKQCHHNIDIVRGLTPLSLP